MEPFGVSADGVNGSPQQICIDYASLSSLCITGPQSPPLLLSFYGVTLWLIMTSFPTDVSSSQGRPYRLAPDDAFDSEGYDSAGFDRLGYRRDGFNGDGFDANGYDRQG